MKDVKILLVEDNEGDILLTTEALKDARIRNEVFIAMDGKEALDMLQNGQPLPDLILLDINLPKLDGLELLAIIKKDNRLKSIPVIMLTTSSAGPDISNAYANHANCFITKPVDLDQFMEVIKAIEQFWINIVRLP